MRIGPNQPACGCSDTEPPWHDAACPRNFYDMGAADERARIVALLEYGRTDGGERITSAKHAAEVIRRGDRGPIKVNGAESEPIP